MTRLKSIYRIYGLMISLIITTLNEQETVARLLEAIAAQTRQPSELIIVDGGSTDNTQQLIKNFQASQPKLKLKLLSRSGSNISQGRNFAISQAENELIAITDAGCVPEPNWLEELEKAYLQTGKPVVAGYYTALPENNFQQAVVPYVLVMPDKVNPNNFLPASRSMLLEKKIWEQLGGFPEHLEVSEDFAFANQLVKNQVPIAFAPQARVGWLPRQNLVQFAKMIYRFARDDIRAGLLRPKVGLIFIRYLVNLLILVWLWPDLVKLGLFAGAALSAYSWWAIAKNKRYVPDGWFWLPVLQIISDLAVMSGTITGLVIKN
ncbi:MAG: glycosyltransferase [Candidatus Pacebacteria bacterium]|nr:glycosyltransferase [Candidatus Paceibacterota bacterium]